MARKVLTLRCAMLPAKLPDDAQGAILWRGGDAIGEGLIVRPGAILQAGEGCYGMSTYFTM